MAPRLQDRQAAHRDRHKVAMHLRVRDRDRPSLLQLLPEDGQDTAARAEACCRSTLTKRVGLAAESACTYIAASRFVSPITEAGLTAL